MSVGDPMSRRETKIPIAIIINQWVLANDKKVNLRFNTCANRDCLRLVIAMCCTGSIRLDTRLSKMLFSLCHSLTLNAPKQVNTAASNTKSIYRE